MKKQGVIADLLVGLGAVCVIAAAAMVWIPLGLSVAGLIFAWAGVRLESD